MEEGVDKTTSTGKDVCSGDKAYLRSIVRSAAWGGGKRGGAFTWAGTTEGREDGRTGCGERGLGWGKDAQTELRCTAGNRGFPAQTLQWWYAKSNP